MKLKPSAPDWNTEQVKKFLKYRNRRSVDILAQKGDLTAYVNPGDGWRLVEGESVQGRDVFYYSDQVKAWDALHPRTTLVAQHKAPNFQPDQSFIKDVLEQANAIKRSDGRVNRREVMRKLNEIDPNKYHRWRYNAIKQILDDHNIPPLRPQPQDRRKVS